VQSPFKENRMPRPASSSIDDILRIAMEPVLKRASATIARAIADMAAARLDSELQSGLSRARGRRGPVARTARPSRRRSEITKWVADRRARRVPKFVIEMTNGLDTKKKVVAKFGADAVFEKGKPLPKVK
jgi:hypothetical protein